MLGMYENLSVKQLQLNIHKKIQHHKTYRLWSRKEKKTFIYNAI
jgi:hypothetical protein